MATMNQSDSKLIVVSNRLPIAVFTDDSNNHEIRPGTGGLVTALAPIVKRSKGLWIGWPGCDENVPIDRLLNEHADISGFEMVPVKISEEEIQKYYRGFSNRAIWPLFHDLLGQFSFDLTEYEFYEQVNQKFADTIIQHITTEDTVWIHDYQLMDVGHKLRELGFTGKLNFFLHIPFPSYDLFRRFPKKTELMQALLNYDHIGFQTPIDRRNFISCFRQLVPNTVFNLNRRQSRLTYKDHEILVGYYPISIDFNEFNDDASTEAVGEAAWYLRENSNVETLMLGLDRLDYTKGIPERFYAIEHLFKKYPEMIGKISLLQIVVPSRLNVADYQELKEELDSLAGRINGTYSTQGWVPIMYQFRTLDRVQLLAHYKAADIALVTPLRDGMNLVAKEYCAANIDNEGVLILSEFAGAAPQLRRGAILINPYDVNETADAIKRVLEMNEDEKRARMSLMRSEIKKNDVHRWVRWFLNN